MDCFDDLDNQSIDAFRELNNDAQLIEVASATALSPELAELLRTTRQKHIPARQAKHRSCTMEYLFKITSPLTPAVLATAAIFSS
jgi:lipopolysaccharide export LptBFGC system permease protein LptF